MKTDIYFATLDIQQSDMREFILNSVCAWFESNKIDIFIATTTDKEAKSLRQSSKLDATSIWQLADQIQLEYFEIDKKMALIIEESNSNDFTYLVNEFSKVGAKVILLKNAI
jgi:hypothetical protein